MSFRGRSTLATWISPLKGCFLLPFTNQSTTKLRVKEALCLQTWGMIHNAAQLSQPPTGHQVRGSWHHISSASKHITKNITKPHPGFLALPLELSLPHSNSLLCYYPEHWNSESQWMLWKSSKAQSEVISKASKQTKNSLLRSGKNQRVGESLQKTFTLHSLFLNLQVGALQTVPQQSLQVAEKDVAKMLERRCSRLSSWIRPAKGWLRVPHAASSL